MASIRGSSNEISGYWSELVELEISKDDSNGACGDAEDVAEKSSLVVGVTALS